MENSLKHHGVKGQKWGVRRKRDKSSDRSNSDSIRKKKVYEMSNQELRDVNNRLQLESNYKSLRKQSNRGRNITMGVLATAGTIVTAASTAQKLYKLGKPIVNKAIDLIGNWVVKDINRHL